MTGKPPADPGMLCPLFRKDVSRVCHKCAWFTHLTGADPVTGARIDQWMCAQSAVIITTLEAAKAANGAGDATQSLRNDFHQERKAQARLLMSRPIGIEQNRPLELIHDKSPPALENSRGE